MIVDFHTHFYPYRYLDELRKGGGYVALEQDASGRYIIRYTGDYNILTPPLVLIDERLQDMGRAGVDLQVLSLTTPGVEREEPARGVKLAKIVNDSFADIEGKYPTKFRALATLPLQDAGEAADELERACGDLGLRGAVVPSNVAGAPLDSPEFEPVWRRADQLGALVFVHPTSPMNTSMMGDYRLVPLLGFGVDTSLAVLRLILGGLTDRHPRLRLGASHLGGVYPFLRGRLDLGFDVYPECGVKITRPPSEYLKDVWVDTCGYHEEVIAFVLGWLGPKRMLLGSDYPAQIADARAVERVKIIEMRDAEREDILWRNASLLLGL